MAGMLDFLMNGGGSQGPQIGMLAADGFLPVDAAMADEARNAATVRMRRGVKHQGVTEAVPPVEASGIDPWAKMPAAELTNTSMGLGPGAGAGYSASNDPNIPRPAAPPMTAPAAPADAPPSTNDPFSAEPALFQDGAPVTRPRPPEAGANPEPGPGQSGTPLSLAPGDYQDRAALPANATPTIGQGGPAAAPQSALGGIGNTLGGLAKGLWNKATDPNTAATRLALAAGFAGAPSFGTGMSRAFSAAGPAMQADIGNQRINQTAKALVAKGIPPEIAMAAAGNPALLAQILPQAFGAKQRKFTEIGQDLSGNKQYGFVDEVNGKVFDLHGQPLGGSGSGNSAATEVFDNIAKAREAGATQEKLLENVPTELRSGVKAMLGGQALPTNLSNRGAARDTTLKFAHSIDPTFDETLIPARVALQKAYQGGGKNFQETLALNTVGGHLSRLADAAEGLGNTGFKPWNWLVNQSTSALGGNPALVKFRNDLVTTQNELAKAYHGGHVSDSAYNAFSNAIGEAQTPAELKAAIGELGGLLQSKITSNETGYKAGMSGLPLPAQYKSINDEAKHSFDKIERWISGVPAKSAATSPAAAPAPAPQQVTPDIALTQARQAIARGAPRDAVIQRLQQAGVNPAGL